MKIFFVTFLAILATITSAMPTSSPMDTDAVLALRELETRPSRPSGCACTPRCVHDLTFTVSLSDFEKIRNKKKPQACNWKSDACTYSADEPFGFNFRPACHRHDFAYRNMKAQGRFDKKMKRHVDSQFRKDLKDLCRNQLKGIKAMFLPNCLVVAELYGVGSRLIGRRDLEGVNGMVPGRRGADVILEFNPDIEGQIMPGTMDIEG